MSDNVTVNVKGLDALQDALEDLGKKAGTDTLRAATRAGGQVVQQAFADNAPRHTGILAENFDVKTRKGSELSMSAFIGPNGKKIIHLQTEGKTAGLPRTARMIAYLLEFGTSKMPKFPFLTQSWQSVQTKALDRIIEVLREKLGL